MGRLKELLDKQAKDALNEKEAKELEKLLAKADEAEDSSEDDDSEDDEEEKAINEAAKKMADEVQKRVSKEMKDMREIVDSLKDTYDDKADKEVRFIDDPRLGRKTVEELSEMKVVIDERVKKGRKNTTVSEKTVQWLQAVITDDRQKLQVLVEGTGSRGGFLVPDEFANLIIEDIVDASIMRQLATVVSINTDSWHLPQLASRPNVNWRSEGAVKATTTADFSEITLTPYSIAGIVTLSDELVEDARLGVGGSIVNYVAEKLGTDIGLKEDTAFWEGSGSGQPTGVDAYSLTIVNAGAGASDSARADAIKRAPLVLGQGYRNRGVWVMNSRTAQKVATYKDSQNNYLTTGLMDGNTERLVGRPWFEQNDIPDGKAFFGDFSYYYIADRGGMRTKVSDEATVASNSAFERDLTHVRVEKRVDGELALTAAVIEIQNLGAF
jgi:HK97 family phage major capsid protein